MTTALKSIDTIKREYDGNLVYLDRIQLDDMGNVTHGRVLYYATDRELFNTAIKSIPVNTTTMILPLTPSGKGHNVWASMW